MLSGAMDGSFCSPLFQRWLRELFQIHFFKLIYLFIYFWLHWVLVAARGLFSSCSERGLLFFVVRGLLVAVASLVAEHRL